METPVSLIESLFDKGEAYAKTNYELAKLKTVEAAIHIITSLISRISVVILISFFLSIFSIGAALFLGELLGKAYYGFFIVAAFYLLAAVVLYMFSYDWIKKPVSNLIIAQILQ